jgi:beta-lactamase superfamily II metal-dependent hydrolase
MKLKIFESHDGDCLLLESKDGKRILCDGGRTGSMRSQVSEELAKLRKSKSKLDIVYVSHVDNDHITGVLALLEDELEWRIHAHRVKNGLKKARPKVPRPPEIGTIWHNAFRDQVKKNNADDIESLLAAAVPTLNGTGVRNLETAAAELGDLATAVQEALKVSALVSPELLNIPVNQLKKGDGTRKLLMLRPGQQAFELGSLKITIVGPGTKELEDLRKGWNNWLTDNNKTVKEIRAQMKKRIDEFSSGTLNGELFDLHQWNGIPPYKNVTTPNIASLMLMVEEHGADGDVKRVLLTGDAQQDYVVKGLEETGFLNEKAGVHLDVLKVQHHGSENNVDAKFCRRVSADHYIFCGNGTSGNPEPSVIDLVFESRLGPQAKRTLAPEAQDRKFTFWFSTTSKAQKPGSKERKAFSKLESRLEQLRKLSKGKLQLRFNSGTFTMLSI